jgi:hypothetical protein
MTARITTVIREQTSKATKRWWIIKLFWNSVHQNFHLKMQIIYAIYKCELKWKKKISLSDISQKSQN